MIKQTLSEISFKVYEEDEITETLDRLIREELMECFPNDREHFSHIRIWHTQPAWTVIGFAPDGTVAAHCAMIERMISAGDPRECIHTAGVQGFSVRPAWRKKGISDKMMEIAIDDAKERGLDTGLLFCLPELEKIYIRMGWSTIDVPVTVLDEQGHPSPLPEKNIAMIIPLNRCDFPVGEVDIMGPDW